MGSVTAVLILILGGLMTGCAANQPRTTSEVWPLYRPAEFGYAGGGRDTYVVLRGNPFAMDTAQFEQTVLRHMQGQHWGPRTNFTTRPTDYHHDFKVVMLFNGPHVNGGELCRNPGAIPFRGGPQAELHVQAVYCRHDHYLTMAQGWLKPEGANVTELGFSRLINQVTAELFPPFNKDDARRDSPLLRRRH